MSQNLIIVNYLRGFAIFTIALMHLVQGSLSGIFHTAASFGGAGGHVFILCSGSGLYLSHIKRHLQYGEFLKKRFSRIYWPYVIAVIFYAVWQWYVARFEFFQWRELLSHIFLYKMFSSSLDVSICYPFWFISTIIQFYIFWPLIVKLMELKHGLLYALFISVTWWIVVGILGYEDYRPWGSSFLQYLWEFCLGMQLAKWYVDGKFSEEYLDKRIKTFQLLIVAILGMALTGIMGKMGGGYKLFNDIPSLVGYMSLLLFVYKLKIKMVNSFFCWSNKFSYSLYLVHSLVYSIIRYLISGSLPTFIEICICIIMAYVCAYGYERFIKLIKTTKQENINL